MIGMTASVTIDKVGRIVLPQQVRRHFGLQGGDRLSLDVLPDGIRLRPPSHPAALVLDGGLLVHRGEATDDLAQAVERARDDRDRTVLGLRR